MLQKYLTTILALFVVWLASPHSTCCCPPPRQDETVIATCALESSRCCCCEPQENSPSCHQVSRPPVTCSTTESCCQNAHIELVAYSSEAVPFESQYISSMDKSTWTYPALTVETKAAVSWRNRAPPPGVGFGSSRTYLYKCSLLI